MKMTKKLITLLLAAMLLLSLAVPAMADDIEDEDSLGFEIEEGFFVFGLANGSNPVVFMTRYTGPDGNVVIPSSIDVIGSYAFYNCSTVTSITIPESVIEIGSEAFVGCPNLTDVYFEGTQKQWEAITTSQKIAYEGYIFGDGVNPTVHFNGGNTNTPTGFRDVPADAWYAESVAWALEKEITNGTSESTFSPEVTCSNAHILTFLWRALGKPNPEDSNDHKLVGTNGASVTWYGDAVNWATNQGMVSYDTFDPDMPCTRASAVMFIWQACGKPAASSAASFGDVPADADYAAAVAWAVEKGVTNGTGTNKFSPDNICTRGHIVTFLQRAFA